MTETRFALKDIDRMVVAARTAPDALSWEDVLVPICPDCGPYFARKGEPIKCPTCDRAFVLEES